MAEIKLHGNPVHTNGVLPAVGSQAPDFTLVDKDLNDVSLANFAGKRKILSVVGALDTGTCANSTKKLEGLLKGRDDVVVLVISADLPPTQARFCAAEKIEQVQTLSMMRSRSFAKDYGILLTDGPLAGITARSIIVLDEDNRVLHTELVAEFTEEPDHDAAFAALG
jgi:thioredoxin-dependent peroxiredoxin